MHKLYKGNYSGEINKWYSDSSTLMSTVQYHPENKSIGMHYHENSHICMLLQGEDIEKRNGSSYLRSSGDVFFYPSGQVHGTISQKCYTKNFIVEFESVFLKKYELLESQIETSLSKNKNVKFQLLRLFSELEHTSDCNSLTIETLLLELLLPRIEHIKDNSPRWNKHVLEILSDKWNQTVSLKELSMAVQIHPVAISKYFSIYNNCTIGEYIRKIRIEKSIPMLKNSNMKLGEIAYYCGFADQSHFIRSFKKLTGFLPLELRKNIISER